MAEYSVPNVIKDRGDGTVIANGRGHMCVASFVLETAVDMNWFSILCWLLWVFSIIGNHVKI